MLECIGCEVGPNDNTNVYKPETFGEYLVLYRVVGIGGDTGEGGVCQPGEGKCPIVEHIRQRAIVGPRVKHEHASEELLNCAGVQFLLQCIFLKTYFDQYRGRKIDNN